VQCIVQLRYLVLKTERRQQLPQRGCLDGTFPPRKPKCLQLRAWHHSATTARDLPAAAVADAAVLLLHRVHVCSLTRSCRNFGFDTVLCFLWQLACSLYLCLKWEGSHRASMHSAAAKLSMLGLRSEAACGRSSSKYSRCVLAGGGHQGFDDENTLLGESRIRRPSQVTMLNLS
jgi:hypothetical protein